MRKLHSHLALFSRDGSQASAPHGLGPVSAVRWLKSWGLQMELADEFETGSSLSLALITEDLVLDSEACLAIYFDPDENLLSAISGSEELVGDVDAPGTYSQQSSQSWAYEELLMVVTRAVDKFSLEWPDEKKEVRGVIFDEHFLTNGKMSVESHRYLSFISDLHIEVSRSWGFPYLAYVHNSAMTNYLAIVGFKEHGYLRISWVKKMLVSHLSPALASTLKRPTLLSRPFKVTSGLMGKVYEVAGQAGVSLYTIVVLQAYQADLLKDLDSGEGIDPQLVRELCQGMDLAYGPTKQTAHTSPFNGYLIAMEKQLWLNLSGIKNK